MKPPTEPNPSEPILLTWSPLPDADQDGILFTTGTYTLANSAGFIDVTVQGKDPDAIKEFTQNTRFAFYISDEPPVQAPENPDFGAQDAPPEQVPPPDENGLSFSYVFRPNDVAFSPGPVPTIAFAMSAKTIGKGWIPGLHVFNAKAVSAAVQVSAGKIWAGIVNIQHSGWDSSGEESAGGQISLNNFSPSPAAFMLGIYGRNDTNTYSLSGSSWS